MTTLQDRVEAYTKFAAAGALDATSTASGGAAELEEVPRTTEHEFRRVELPLIVVAEWIIQGGLSVGLQEHTWSAWTALKEEIPSKNFSLLVSPFDQLDERRKDQEKVRELIAYVRFSLPVSFASKLAKRLKFLSEVAEEEAPDQLGLSPESLRMFIKFLVLSPNLECPGVVLSPSGNVRIQWRAALNKLFVAEFYRDGEVRFVIFRPDPKRPNHTIRLSGTASVESLLSTAEPHGVLEWAGA